MQVLLVSLYELGRQPFGLASPAAWLKEVGAEVRCADLAVEPLVDELVISADLVAVHVPMHTATRLAIPLAERVRSLNPSAHLCFYGLYAPMNEGFLRDRLGAATILGGEFEEGLVSLVERLRAGSVDESQPEPVVSLAKQRFLIPDRSVLPSLDRYAYLTTPSGERRTVGYTEASRGCKHLCRHCPIVPVYGGRFRVVQREIVLEDVRRQVAAGARHITFGDPDFFNGPTHAVTIVEALHEEFPDVTYDVTIKVEHLLKQARHLETLRDTGCAFVTSAVEAVDDAVLEIFDKSHTRADFIETARLFAELGLVLNPTFVTFTPWTTIESYLDLLALLAELDLVEHMTPVQYGIRLLIPDGSRLLELAEVCELVDSFDEERLVYPWTHPDPRVDRLCEDVLAVVRDGQRRGAGREAIYGDVWALAARANGRETVAPTTAAPRRGPIPFLNEPWYC